MLGFIMWVCAALAIFSFVGFTARSFMRMWRCEPGFGWLADLWSAIVITTVLGGAAITIWLITNVPPHP
jgi:hypothetical protein